MRTITKTIPLALVAAAAMTSTASAKSVNYVGKTDSGHKVTFTLKDGRIYDFDAGIRMSCISIQGGGAPMGGSELWGWNKGSVKVKRHNQFSFMGKPAFHYNEVKLNHDLWLTKRPNRVFTGRMRLQYQFLIPKYPIGTFSIYSCLGGAKFKASPKG